VGGLYAGLERAAVAGVVNTSGWEGTIGLEKLCCRILDGRRGVENPPAGGLVRGLAEDGPPCEFRSGDTKGASGGAGPVRRTFEGAGRSSKSESARRFFAGGGGELPGMGGGELGGSGDDGSAQRIGPLKGDVNGAPRPVRTRAAFFRGLSRGGLLSFIGLDGGVD
jgi:hypothetical protein